MDKKQENIKTVIANCYYKAAEAECNMHQITDILEEVRTLLSEELDFKKTDERLLLHLGEILDTEEEFNTIKNFREELREMERQNLANEIDKKYKQEGTEKGWEFWLSCFALELSKLNTETCNFLIELKPEIPGPLENEFEFIFSHFQYIKDERWVEGNPLFEFFIQKKLKSKTVNADLNILVGEVWLYHLMDAEKANHYFKKAARLIPGTPKAERALGLYFIEKKDFQNARQHLQKALELDKKDAENYLVLGDMFKAEKKYETAAGWYNEGLRENPGKADLYNRLLPLNEQPAYFEKYQHEIDELLNKIFKLSPEIYYTALNNAGFVYQKNGNFEKAEQYYHQALSFKPERILAWINLGYSFLEKNDLDESEKSFKNAINIDENSFDGYWGMAAVNRRKENWSAVIENLKRCEKQREAWLPFIYNDFGTAYEKLEDLKNAEKYYLLALEHDPEKLLGLNALYGITDKNPDSDQNISLLKKIRKIKGPDYESNFWHESGVIYFKNEQYDKAVENFKKSTELTPNDPVRLEYLGLAYEKSGDFENAIEYYNKAINESTTDKGKYLNRLGFLLTDLGKYDEAVKMLQKAIELDPNPIYFENLGYAYENAGNKPEAKIWYLKALEIAKQEKDKYENRLGVFFYNQQLYEKAIHHYLNAVRINEKPIYFENIGLAYEKMNRLKEAEEYYRHALNTSVQTNDADTPRYYNQLAFFLSKNDKHEEAANLLEKAVQLKPLPMYLENLGFAYEKMGLTEKAKQNYQEALNREKFNKDIYLNRLGVFYYNQFDSEKAIEFYEKAIDVNPKAVYFENLGKAWLDLKQREPFENAMLEAAKTNPEDGRYYFQLGWNILDNFNDTEAAKKYLYKALEIYKKTPEIEPEELLSIQYLGAAYELEGNWDKAEEIFLEAHRIEPENDLICSFLGKIYQNKNNLQKSLEYYEKAYHINADRQNNCANLGNILAELGEEKKALEIYTEGAKSDPTLYEKIAKIYFNSGNFAEAEKYIRLALDEFPNFYTYWENLGLILQKQSRHKEAIEAFTTALENTSHEYADFYLNLIGNEWFALGEYEKAAGFYEDALNRKPEDPVYFKNLILALGYSYQTTKAKEKLREKLEKEPSDIYAINQLGILYFQEGDYSQALEYFKKHIELEPDNAVAYDNLGFAFEKLNQPETAAEIYLKGVPYDSSFYEKAIKNYIDLEDYETARKIYNKAKQVQENWDFANPNLNQLLNN